MTRTFSIDKLLLGWKQAETDGKWQAVYYEGDAPLLTCAPTRSGKGRGVIIPNALLYSGGLVVIDPKGEIAQITSRQRCLLGQEVHVIDPWHVVTEKSAGLDILDLLTLPKSSVDGDCEMLAS